MIWQETADELRADELRADEPWPDFLSFARRVVVRRSVLIIRPPDDRLTTNLGRRTLEARLNRAKASPKGHVAII